MKKNTTQGEKILLKRYSKWNVKRLKAEKNNNLTMIIFCIKKQQIISGFLNNINNEIFLK